MKIVTDENMTIEDCFVISEETAKKLQSKNIITSVIDTGRIREPLNLHSL